MEKLKNKLKLSIVQQELSQLFSSLGQTIARRPLYFIILPIIASTTLFLTGLLRMQANREMEYLFTAENGIADQNKKLIDEIFPMNTSKLYDPVRLTSSTGFIVLQITPKDEKSIFRESVIKDVVRLDGMIRNISISIGNKSFDYNQVCGKKEGACITNNFFEIAERYKEIKTGKYKIKYPMDINNLTLTYKEYIFALGGIELDEYGYVKEAKATRLMYAFDITDKSKQDAIQQWRNVAHSILEMAKFDNIDFVLFSSDMITDELKYFTDILMPLMPFVIIIILLFAFVSLMTNDCIRSKPWLGAFACISAALAVTSGFGFVFLLGVEYIDYTIFLVYSILVIEIDDAFVLIAAWRRTNPENNVQKRMSESFYQAGVSVTATSITNFTSLCVGMASPFPIIRIFCIYAAASMFFTYVYQITFFGACMAISGYREEKGIHPFFCCCAKNNRRTALPSDNNVIYNDSMMKLFRDKLGFLLTFKPTKIFIIVIFIANLCTGLSGLWYVKKGNDIQDMFSYDSVVKKSLSVCFKYFSTFQFPVHVIVDQPLNYADKNVQNSVENMLRNFEILPNIADSSLRISWLKYYIQFSGMPIGKFLMSGYNISNKQEFIDGLRNIFLKFPRAEQFKQDIAFNEDHTDIIASRFLLIPKDIHDQEQEVNLVRDINKVTDGSPIKIRVYSFAYRYLEQAILINKQTFQTGVIATSLVCLISLIFLPNIPYAICVSLVVCCIIFEVIGYMSLWNVNIDLIFLSCFVLCVGFSINHPTHITYSFMTASTLNPNGRIQNSIYEIGFAVVQGTLSTVLGILILAFQPFYISLAGVKLICLFAIQTAFHSLFVIPVFLNIIDNIHTYLCRNSKDKIPNPDTDFTILHPK